MESAPLTQEDILEYLKQHFPTFSWAFVEDDENTELYFPEIRGVYKSLIIEVTLLDIPTQNMDVQLYLKYKGGRRFIDSRYTTKNTDSKFSNLKDIIIEKICDIHHWITTLYNE